MNDPRMYEHNWARNLGALVVLIGICWFLGSVDTSITPDAVAIEEQHNEQ